MLNINGVFRVFAFVMAISDDNLSTVSSTQVVLVIEKFCSECGAESAPAGQRLPAAGGDRAWAARTGSGQMWMCGDIFAAARLWRGRLLTTGHLSSRHPVVVGAGDVVGGMSEDNDRCFSMLVLLTVVFQHHCITPH